MHVEREGCDPTIVWAQKATKIELALKSYELLKFKGLNTSLLA
jgi:hypothetical protein